MLSPEELNDEATFAKNEGNKHFKSQKYRWAIDSYTNGVSLIINVLHFVLVSCYLLGIRICCLDRELNAILYANRAAAQKRIGNLRSSLKDCVIAKKFDSSHKKVLILSF